jgi:uncharacterized membrane-anchored protein YhcB (DUF1043 family)
MHLTFPQIQALIWLDSFGPSTKKDYLSMKMSSQSLTVLERYKLVIIRQSSTRTIINITFLGQRYTRMLRHLCDESLSLITDKVGKQRQSQIIKLGKQVSTELQIGV